MVLEIPPELPCPAFVKHGNKHEPIQAQKLGHYKPKKASTSRFVHDREMPGGVNQRILCLACARFGLLLPDDVDGIATLCMRVAFRFGTTRQVSRAIVSRVENR